MPPGQPVQRFDVRRDRQVLRRRLRSRRKQRQLLQFETPTAPGSTCGSPFQRRLLRRRQRLLRDPRRARPASAKVRRHRARQIRRCVVRNPTRTRTVSPTRSASPGTPTPTPPAGATATLTPPTGGTVTPTPSATRTGSPVTSARLVSAVSATDTSISVDNATAFPDAGTFLIDSEQIAYTAKFGNTFVNVQRGANGSTAAAHVSGSLVRFLSTTVPTPPRPTATPQPRDVIYRSIGDGSRVRAAVTTALPMQRQC